MHDRHTTAGWALGAAGLCLAVVSMFTVHALALLGGICALGAGALAGRRRAPSPAPPPPLDRRRPHPSPTTRKADGPRGASAPAGAPSADADATTAVRRTDPPRSAAGPTSLWATRPTPASTVRRTESTDVWTVPAERSTDPAAAGVTALIDPVTGLFGEDYLLLALDARIAAARRRLRPLSVVLFDVAIDPAAPNRRPAEPWRVAAAIRATLREADTTGRFGDGLYLLVLEDTPEPGAIWTVERLRSALGAERPGATLWAGVACYPAHALESEEILGQARRALVQARQWPSDRIEVAVEP